MKLRAVEATRYVMPLREGGSLPGLVEASDDGLYVAKFRGAGQGTGALVAEAVAGELAKLDPSERFHWLASPSSTIIQPSAVHTGLCDDPEAELNKLFRALVELPQSDAR